MPAVFLECSTGTLLFSGSRLSRGIPAPQLQFSQIKISSVGGSHQHPGLHLACVSLGCHGVRRRPLFRHCVLSGVVLSEYVLSFLLSTSQYFERLFYLLLRAPAYFEGGSSSPAPRAWPGCSASHTSADTPHIHGRLRAEDPAPLPSLPPSRRPCHVHLFKRGPFPRSG